MKLPSLIPAGIREGRGDGIGGYKKQPSHNNRTLRNQ
jgi:hypothetical protein